MSTKKSPTHAKKRQHRSPVAIALDAYLNSDEGLRCCDPTTIGAHPEQHRFLRNRIESAWIEGAKWATQTKTKS